MAQRYPELLKVLVGQLRQDVSVDFALAERCLVLTKSKASQPPADVHGLPMLLGSMMVYAEKGVQRLLLNRKGSVQRSIKSNQAAIGSTSLR